MLNDFAQPADYGHDYGQNYGYDFGEFVGTGSKGYRRSDDRILRDVQDALAHSESINAAAIDVSVNDGEITLTGSVLTPQQKRDAERRAQCVLGVFEVHNQLRVD